MNKQKKKKRKEKKWMIHLCQNPVLKSNHHHKIS